ncbi:hypothetical protein P43SY_011026 [Pythium insidiosum]|uniref:Uncharacterized protein n=1 Tax=Pythium insidiosum TaxID=114742 RepID=A0AAD5L7U8_PYTIN|nr:hypothetical protein P43SY_011026 [Pythium insidiosum]
MLQLVNRCLRSGQLARQPARPCFTRAAQRLLALPIGVYALPLIDELVDLLLHTREVGLRLISLFDNCSELFVQRVALFDELVDLSPASVRRFGRTHKELRLGSVQVSCKQSDMPRSED